MASLEAILSQFPILSAIVPHLTTKELFSVTTSSKTLWETICTSPSFLKHLKAQTLCDGIGVAMRKAKDSAITDRQTPNLSMIFSPQNLVCLGADTEQCDRCEVSVCNVRKLRLRCDSPMA